MRICYDAHFVGGYLGQYIGHDLRFDDTCRRDGLYALLGTNYRYSLII